MIKCKHTLNSAFVCSKCGHFDIEASRRDKLVATIVVDGTQDMRGK